MCHRIVAEKVCEDCSCKVGEMVIDFDACSRKCTTPTYRLSPEPLEVLCAHCMAGRSPKSEASTPSSEPNRSIFPTPFSQNRRKSSNSIVLGLPEVRKEETTRENGR